MAFRYLRPEKRLLTCQRTHNLTKCAYMKLISTILAMTASVAMAHDMTVRDISDVAIPGGTSPVPANFQNRPVPKGLSGGQIYPADGKVHTRIWQNATGGTVHIQKFIAIPYFENGSSGTALLIAKRLKDGSTSFYKGVQVPLSGPIPEEDYGSNTIDLAPNDLLELAVEATGSDEIYAHFYVAYYVQ